jgi:hypothetical protein
MPDEPIVVTGGSVTIDFGDAYQPDPSSPPGKKKYKSANLKLVSIEVNGQTVADLKPNDVVKIVCR